MAASRGSEVDEDEEEVGCAQVVEVSDLLGFVGEFVRKRLDNCQKASLVSVIVCLQEKLSSIFLNPKKTFCLLISNKS